MRRQDTPNRWAPLRPAFCLLAVVVFVSLLSGCYMSHIAAGQIRLSCSSVSVEEALRMGCLSESDKARLRYIQDVRRFAEETVHLKRSDNFSTYYPGRHEPLNWIVTAAPKNRLAPVTWWFPIVGTISYKGFFGREAAEDEALDLANDGYDVSVRPAAAYSTMGWFTDPIMPLMLDMGDGELANLIIHELTHGTVFSAGHTTYNESLAEFIGGEGSRQFVAMRFGGESPEAIGYRDRQSDSKMFNTFMRTAAHQLKAVYASRPKDLESARREFFSKMRRDYCAMRPRFKTERYRRGDIGTLNNAVLVGHLAYQTTAPFERAFISVGRDWSRFIPLVKECAEHEDPDKCLVGKTGR